MELLEPAKPPRPRPRVLQCPSCGHRELVGREAAAEGSLVCCVACFVRRGTVVHLRPPGARREATVRKAGLANDL